MTATAPPELAQEAEASSSSSVGEQTQRYRLGRLDDADVRAQLRSRHAVCSSEVARADGLSAPCQGNPHNERVRLDDTTLKEQLGDIARKALNEHVPLKTRRGEDVFVDGLKAQVGACGAVQAVQEVLPSTACARRGDEGRTSAEHRGRVGEGRLRCQLLPAPGSG